MNYKTFRSYILPLILIIEVLSPPMPLHAESSLLVETNVPDLIVSIDGIERGSTDANGRFYLDEISPGYHFVTINKEGYIDHKEAILVEDLTAIVVVEMKPIMSEAASGALPEGNTAILISVNLPGASVSLDGELLGITDANGKFFKECSVGQFMMTIEKEGYWPFEQQILTTEGSITEINTVLKRRTPLAGNKLLLIAIASLVIPVLLLLFYKRYFAPGRFDVFDRKEVIKKGGTATIYRAKDRKTGEIVALKIMHKDLAKDKNLAIEFLNEGKVLSALNAKFPEAPIVQVRRHGRRDDQTDGVPFIAMEIVSGESLMDNLENGPLDIEDAVFIIYSLCQALIAVHSEGIVHGDLSPENVIVSRGLQRIERVILLDFGIPRCRYQDISSMEATAHGKLPYMSPEQCTGNKIDSRSDIYSLGILFYSLLTGKPPFISRNSMNVINGHQTSAPPPLPAYFSEQVRNLIERMLRKNPEERFDSVEAIKEALAYLPML